jgi:hypothetical protein
VNAGHVMVDILLNFCPPSTIHSTHTHNPTRGTSQCDMAQATLGLGALFDHMQLTEVRHPPPRVVEDALAVA